MAFSLSIDTFQPALVSNHSVPAIFLASFWRTPLLLMCRRHTFQIQICICGSLTQFRNSEPMINLLQHIQDQDRGCVRWLDFTWLPTRMQTCTTSVQLACKTIRVSLALGQDQGGFPNIMLQIDIRLSH